MKLPEGEQESILHDVFTVLRVAEELSCTPLKARDAGCKKSVKRGVIQVDGKNRRFLAFHIRCELFFRPQDASFRQRLRRFSVHGKSSARMSPIARQFFACLKCT